MPARSTSSSAADRLREHLATLSTLSQALAGVSDLQELLRTLHREISRVVDATMFVLGLFHESSQTVEIIGQVISGTASKGGSFPLGKGFTSEVIRTRRPLLVRNWSTEMPPIAVRYGSGQGDLPESGITVPLLLGERVVGVLSVQSFAAEAYDEDDLLTLQAIAGLVALTVDGLRRSARLDEQLQRRVSELEAVLASLADALLIVDADGGIVHLNQAARDLLRVDETGIVLGQPLEQARVERWPIGARRVAEALGPLIEALRRGETLRDAEVELIVEGRRVLAFSGAPLRDYDGAVTGGVILCRDVTGRREAERLKDEVLSIASHDLKTPITAIRVVADLLRRRVLNQRASHEHIAEGLTKVVEQSKRLTDLLDLLLDFSRLEAGRFEIDPTPSELVGLIRSVVERVQTTTERHRLVMHAPEAVVGPWDERRIEQVIQNLLANAVKYSPEGGEVAITVEDDGERATVRVRDQGVGIAPEELPLVFERFYRIAGTRRLEGSGLGLYICQAIVSAHGGRIWVESEGVGQGSTFAIELPRGSTFSE